MQLRFHTGLPGEQYVTGELWLLARLAHCPLHPRGGCGFTRHGTYLRKRPRGTLIARWYCPRGHQTFSLLPDHLAARFPGTLPEIEQVVAAAECATSVQACADALRPLTISLTSAVRWVNRRLALVRALLPIIVAMVPQHLQGCAPTIRSLRERLAPAPAPAPAPDSAMPAPQGAAPDGPQGSALVRLRQMLSEHLAALAYPVGFGHRSCRAGEHRSGLQQHKGPDPPRAAA